MNKFHNFASLTVSHALLMFVSYNCIVVYNFVIDIFEQDFMSSFVQCKRSWSMFVAFFVGIVMGIIN